jgi:succinyl-CoA synthetase beta subunit
MTTQYSTTINQMYTLNTPEQGFVVNVLFLVSGTDGTNTASIDGNIQFTDKAESDFIPYDQLTEATVLGWINEATDNQANYYANIDGQIASLVNPPVSPTSEPLPWSN